MSVDTIEASEQDSEPRELLEIRHGTRSYMITFGTRDVLHGTTIYKATAGARGEIGPSASGNGKELVLTLPINHALVRRYVQQATPPKAITVTMHRKYIPSGDIELRWVGEITSMSCDDDGTEATFRVEPTMSAHMLRVIPTTTVGRNCPHVLYDSMCGVDRNSVLFKVTATVIYVSGRDVRIDIGNTNAEGWANGGELKHIASGEVMTVLKQTYVGLPSSVVTLTLQLPIPDLKIGDGVEIYAGCDRTLAQCVSRFDNRHRFGGFPNLPNRNPHTLEGSGAGDS